MSDEHSQLDDLSESDILEALGQEVPENIQTAESVDEVPMQEEHEFINETDDGEITNIPDGLLEAEAHEELEESEGEELEDIGDIEILPMAEIESALEEEELNESITLNSDEAGSLASILSKLLNNKTIEITIKIKD